MHCENLEAQEVISGTVMKGIWNFVKCVQKSMYFANQSLQWLRYCLRDEYLQLYRGMVPLTPGAGMYPNNMPVSDEIVFNFDAFVMAARTVFERNILNGLEALGNPSFAHIAALHTEVFETHVRHGLLPIRNEVVHHGNSGSASRYTGQVTEDANGYCLTIESNFTIDDEEKAADLLDILKRLTQVQTVYSWQVFGIILGYYFIHLGPPRWNAGLNSKDHTIRFSDFEIPNSEIDLSNLSNLWPIWEDDEEE